MKKYIFILFFVLNPLYSMNNPRAQGFATRLAQLQVPDKRVEERAEPLGTAFPTSSYTYRPVIMFENLKIDMEKYFAAGQFAGALGRLKTEQRKDIVWTWLRENGTQLLIRAVKTQNKLHVEKVLTEYCKEVNCFDKDGMSPLHWAVHNNNIAIIDLLSAAQGFNVDICYHDGDTPLCYALKTGKFESARKLLELGACTDFTVDGESAREFLLKKQDDLCVRRARTSSQFVAASIDAEIVKVAELIQHCYVQQPGVAEESSAKRVHLII